MYISKIYIENVRCFENIEIDLTSEIGINQRTVFLGNNGVGKTTILRAIALSFCEESGAAGLLDELQGDWIRNGAGKKPARIRIEFEKPIGYKKKKNPYIETKIRWSKYKEIKLEQDIEPENRKFWDKLFVAAYGADRRSFGATSFDEYTAIDGVYTLFNYAAPLQNPELNLRRWQSETDIKALLEKIEDILLLKKGSIKLDRSGISINGPWGNYLPMGALGDGYQATLAWIMDMYGWKLLYEKKELEDIQLKGIVLVDELEQHLHPVWQKEILNRLARQFKHVQFFFTTHSPIVAINSFKTRETDPNSKIFHIDWNGEASTDISEVQEPINDLDYSQLLASEAFGHMISTNTKVEELLKEMSELASIDNPSKKQKIALATIKKELKKLMFPKGRTLIEREVEREYYRELESKADYFKKILDESK